MACEITRDSFGHTKDGRDVTRFTLRNSTGSLVVRVMEYGAVVTEILLPGRDGAVVDVTPGFDDIQGHEACDLYFGAIMGRFANRIAGAKFTLDGKTYNLFVNNGPNCLHGGKVGYHKRLWSGRVEGDRVLMTYVSPDGEEGFPGELTTTVSYAVTDDDELVIEYEGTATKPTPVNLTSHIYFNLAGHDAGRVDDHVVTIHADSYLPPDENSVPTGEVRKVEGSPLDLRKPVRLGDHMLQVPGGKGFDHTFPIPPCDGPPQRAARVEHPPSGRYVECFTTEPSLHFYSGFYLHVARGKGGATYSQCGGLCLEAQHYPDSVNQPHFPSTILRPGETYRQTTLYRFGVV